jgi:hypothetical protein
MFIFPITMSTFRDDVVFNFLNFYYHPGISRVLEDFYKQCESDEWQGVTELVKKNFSVEILHTIVEDGDLLKMIRTRGNYEMPGDWERVYSTEKLIELCDVYEKCIDWVVKYKF